MPREIICGIYRITSPTGKMYVGQATDIYKRWNVYRLGHIKFQTALKRSINKHTWELHKAEIIEICKPDQLNEREIHWIKELGSYGTPLGMNLTTGGEGAKGLVLSAEVRKKFSEMKKGLLVGERNGMYGRGHTPETRELQKEIWAVRRISQEYNSLESKKKRSDAQLGNKNSAGKTPTTQTRNKISKTLKTFFEVKENHPFYKKSHKPETKKILSDAVKELWVKLKNTDEYNSEFRKKKRSDDQKKAWETRRRNLQKITV